MIRYECPGCKTLLENPDSMAGKPDSCPVCGMAAIVTRRSAGSAASTTTHTKAGGKRLLRGLAAAIVATVLAVGLLTARYKIGIGEAATQGRPAVLTASLAAATTTMASAAQAPAATTAMANDRAPRASNEPAAPEMQILGYATYDATGLWRGRDSTPPGPAGMRKAHVVLVRLPTLWLVPSEAAYQDSKAYQARIKPGGLSAPTAPHNRCSTLDKRQFALRTASGVLISAAGLPVWSSQGELTSPMIARIERYGVETSGTTIVPICWIAPGSDLRPPLVVECYGRNAAVPEKVLGHSDIVASLGKDYNLFEQIKIDIPQINIPEFDITKFKIPNIDIPKLDIPKIDPELLRPPVFDARFPGFRGAAGTARKSPSSPRAIPVRRPARAPTPEEEADKLWQLAEAYLTNGLKSKAGEFLADFVQRYPSSSHAAEAKQKLDALEKGM